MLALPVIFCCASMAQDGCPFQILDTITTQRAYVLSIRTHDQDVSASNARLALFHWDSTLTSAVQPVDPCLENMYLSTAQLQTAIVVFGGYRYVSSEGSPQYGSTMRLLREEVDYQLYELFSPNGFVHWTLSDTSFNAHTGYEKIKLKCEAKCIHLYSPTSNNIAVLERLHKSPSGCQKGRK